MDKTVRADRGKHARGEATVLVNTGIPRSAPCVELGEVYGSGDEWAAALEAFPEWAAENLWIDTKGAPGEARFQKFELNFAQRQIHKRVVARARAGLPIWIVIPKARQTGVSTYCQGLESYLTCIFDHPVHDKTVKAVARPGVCTTKGLEDYQGLAQLLGPVYGPLQAVVPLGPAKCDHPVKHEVAF